MAAIPIGTIVKSLATQDEWLVCGYRADDDTAFASDTDAQRLARLDCSSADMVVVHAWDSEVAANYRRRLRLALLDHANRPTAGMAVVISDQLDHVGELLPL